MHHKVVRRILMVDMMQRITTNRKLGVGHVSINTKKRVNPEGRFQRGNYDVQKVESLIDLDGEFEIVFDGIETS